MNWIFTINTQSKGSIDLGMGNDRFHGPQVVLHIDQTSNINNGEDEASIVVNLNELKELQEKLSSFIIYLEGK